MEQKDSSTNPPSPTPSFKRSLFRTFMWALLFAGVLFYLTRGYTEKNRDSIAYSEFKTIVRNGGVTEVIMKGNTIEGKYSKPKAIKDASGNSITQNEFTTVMPSVSDVELLPLLEEKNVALKAENADSNWMSSLLLLFIPWLLIIGYFVYASRNMTSQLGKSPMGGLFSVGKSKAKRFRKEMSSTTYSDVAGLANAKKDLQEIVDYLKDPAKFTSLGATSPKGILLMGPPGTGKTLLARATAGEAGVPFFSTSGSEFIEMFVGVGASRVRDLFENAKREAPAIIFIDELDSIGRVRGTGLGGSHDEREQTLNQILTEMDGFEPHESVVVMAATNRPDVLDPALTRPGRFDRQVSMDFPEKNARIDILKIHSKNVPLAPEVSLSAVAARTVGFTGADLKNLVNEAALLAGRKGKTLVDMKDFDSAQDKVMLGSEREEKLDEKEKEVVAYHEAGHALIAKLLPEADPLQKVSIISRGRALGVTEQIPVMDRHNFDKSYLLSRICVALGGRSSEKLIYNELTNGASEDLKTVTSIARKMVCQWGMSEKIGASYYSLGEEHPFLGRELAHGPREFSENTARIIDEEIQHIIGEQEERALTILRENRTKLVALTKALLEQETLDKAEVDKVLDSLQERNLRIERLAS